MPRLMRSLICFWLLLTLTWGWSLPAWAQAPADSLQPYLDRVIDRVSEFTLDNGMKFIVLERHQAPVVSFMTYVDVGAAYEQPGKTGAAHFLEHLAFKGTTRIGTQNYEAEQLTLDRLDRVYAELQAAQAAGRTEQATELQTQFDTLNAEAASYVVQNQFGQIVEQAGGVGLNATTSADETRYFYSFPSNKLELWMSLESERFLEPVFREFYEEKEVILEERRLRTENSPIGKMTELFLETAFPDQPYGRPVIGYEADIRSLQRQDIQQFYDTYYTPNRMVLAVVGDVDPAQVKSLAEAYFGRYQTRSQAPDIEATAPQQTEPREVTLQLPTEPLYIEGYQRPAVQDDQNAVYDMIASLLIGGRTSRLYRSLVERQQVALSVSISESFPGDRYPALMMIFALTAPGHTIEEVAAALDAELDRLKTEPVSAAELDRIKTQARTGLLTALASNQGMASLLAEYEAKTGSWRNLFADLEAIETVTAADVQTVAQSLFQPQKLTIGKLLPVSGG